MTQACCVLSSMTRTHMSEPNRNRYKSKLRTASGLVTDVTPLDWTHTAYK